jgi:transcriptional regulator with XRE-family HTH domain
MPEDTAGSYVPRLLLGQRLKELREQSGVGAQDAADEVGIARATLWRMEKGDRKTRYKPGDVEMLARIYGADHDTIDLLSGLAKSTKGKSWFSAFRDVLPANFEMYIDLETYANRIRWYDGELVPGLMHTEDYARVVIGSRRRLTNSEVRKRAQVRMTRQKLLTRRQPRAARFEFVVDEAVLVRPLGGATVMAEQLAHLLKLGELPNVAIRVVPFSAGMHLGLETGRFEVLDFPKNPRIGSPPTTVFVEQSAGDLFLDGPKEIELYEETFNDLLDRALGEAASRDLIDEAARRFDRR